jgi:hypothetical protein
MERGDLRQHLNSLRPLRYVYSLRLLDRVSLVPRLTDLFLCALKGYVSLRLRQSYLSC